MEIEKVASAILYTGSLLLIFGMLTLIILQLMLGSRLNRSFFTFLSVVFYPNYELTSSEKLIKRIGIVLSVIGSVTILISGLVVWYLGKQ